MRPLDQILADARADKESADKTPDGPWTIRRPWDEVVVYAADGRAVAEAENDWPEPCESIAAFISRARSSVPRMAADIEAMAAEITMLRERLERYHGAARALFTVECADLGEAAVQGAKLAALKEENTEHVANLKEIAATIDFKGPLYGLPGEVQKLTFDIDLWKSASGEHYDRCERLQTQLSTAVLDASMQRERAERAESVAMVAAFERGRAEAFIERFHEKYSLDV